MAGVVPDRLSRSLSQDPVFKFLTSQRLRGGRILSRKHAYRYYNFPFLCLHILPQNDNPSTGSYQANPTHNHKALVWDAVAFVARNPVTMSRNRGQAYALPIEGDNALFTICVEKPQLSGCNSTSLSLSLCSRYRMFRPRL